MRPAVVTAVLLSLCITLSESVDRRFRSARPICQNYEFKRCEGGQGWNRLDAKRCAKLFWWRKTFDDALKHCKDLEADLVSLHSEDDMLNLLCLTAVFQRLPAWIGARKSPEGALTYTDGSEVQYSRWHHGEPDNAGGHEDCVVTNFNDFGWWSDVPCSQKNYFLCVKTVPELTPKPLPVPEVNSCH